MAHKLARQFAQKSQNIEISKLFAKLLQITNEMQDFPLANFSLTWSEFHARLRVSRRILIAASLFYDPPRVFLGLLSPLAAQPLSTTD